MVVCYFGTYNPTYPRNRVLIEALRRQGVKVIECHSRGLGVWKYISLAFQSILKLRNVDAIIVGFPMGRGVMTVLKSLDKLRMTRGCPVVIDGFVSQYDAEVFDRRHVAQGSRGAKQLFNWEQNAFQFASKVLTDTNANAEYYSTLFFLPREHFAVVPVGTDETLFYPRSGHCEESVMNHGDEHQTIVHFSGTYSFLHGIDVIVRAASLIQEKSLRFRLVGNGEMRAAILRLARELNVFDRIEFIDRVPYDEYARLTREADLCLGIFSDSAKAQRVVPNKVVEAMACGKAIITADTPAVRELLTDGASVMLCRPNDPESLARAVMKLYQDESLRLKLGENARKVFLEKLTANQIGKILLVSLTGRDTPDDVRMPEA